MDLLEMYLPQYDVRDAHDIVIRNNSSVVYQQFSQLDFSSSFITKALFKLRGLPVSKYTIKGLISGMRFTEIDAIQSQEYLFGFWGSEKIEPITNKKLFISTTDGIKMKVVCSFKFEPIENGHCRVVTETRVKSYTKLARLTFRLYWFFIGPFSGLIRKEWLRILKKNSESS